MKIPALLIVPLTLLLALPAHGEAVEPPVPSLSKMDFDGVPLSKVLETLAELSIMHDPKGVGVNIVLLDPTKADPKVNLKLRNVSLEMALNHITASVDYQWNIEDDAVVVRPGANRTGIGMETRTYSLSRSAVVRMIGHDPTRTRAEETELLKQFFNRAGVEFQ